MSVQKHRTSKKRASPQDMTNAFERIKIPPGMKQWMMMRRVLEMEVVANCAVDMSEHAIGQLGQNLAYQRAALDSGDLQGFHEPRYSIPSPNGGWDRSHSRERGARSRPHASRESPPNLVAGTRPDGGNLRRASGDPERNRIALSGTSQRRHASPSGPCVATIADVVAQHPGVFDD